MNENKLPQFESVEALTKFFDDNDMSQYFEAMPEVDFEVDIQRRSFLLSVNRELMKKLADVAKARHTSTNQLVNQWLEEKIARAA